MNLQQAYAKAASYWADHETTRSRGRESMMTIRARAAVAVLGPSLRVKDLSPETHGPKLLSGLANGGRKGHRSRATVAVHLKAFLRMLALAGHPQNATAWPSAPTPERKLAGRQSPVTQQEVDAVARWMRLAKRWNETADLIELLWRTGLRSYVEGIRSGASEVDEAKGVLHVRSGKGGHERLVPVRPGTSLEGLDRLTYEGHLRRLKVAVRELGFEVFTFHDLRRSYATRAYEATGKDLAATQRLLGHSKPETTVGYLRLPVEEMRSVAF